MVKLLLHLGASLATKDHEGHNAYSIAESKGHLAIVQHITQHQQRQGGGSSSGGSRARSQSTAAASASVPDQARIMQVWEKFFENAFQVMLVREVDLDTMDCRLVEDYRSSGSDSNGNNDDDDEEEENDNGARGGEVFECGEDIMQWYSWLLCFGKQHHNHQRATTDAIADAYFVLNMFDTEQPALTYSEHLATQYATCDFEIDYGKVSIDYTEYPTSLDAAMRQGWMFYFDLDSNCTVWLHLPSGVKEPLLPLGGLAEEAGAVARLGCQVYDQDPSWVYAYQLACHAWMMVGCEVDGELRWYYCNRISGQSTWTEPLGWQHSVVDHNAGWVLCTTEAIDYYYW